MENDALLEKVTAVDGCRVLGPCAIYSRLGQGGMGAVYRARHMNLGIDVAVKCLKPSLADPQFVKRFKFEAKSAARIGHQNVVRVFDVAEDQGLHYIIMELVQGETARQRVERKGPLAIGEALEILYGAALGLAEAHRSGIIHRDIKPDNILISSNGEVKLVDLGLAKPSFRDASTSMLSSANQVLGTLQYMPPEQWESTVVTMAADIWALGATFFFLVAGREAINDGTPPQIMNRIVNHPFPDVRRVRGDVPDDVIALLARATAKSVQDRFEDAEALATAISELETRRSGLRDSEAGTTQLRALVSPPPQRTLDKIQTLLQVGPQYPGARLETKPPPLARPAPSTSAPKPAPTATSAAATTESRPGAARGRRAALATVGLVLVLGIGALLFVPGVRKWVSRPPTAPDPLAVADPLETQQDSAKATAAAGEAGPDLAFAEQIAAVEMFAGRAVTASDTIRLRGKLSDPGARLFLGGSEIAMDAQPDGSFTCEARDLAVGENDLVFEARKPEQPKASCRLKILRLAAPPLTVNASSTESARCQVEVTSDAWTKTVEVIIAGKRFPLQQRPDDKAAFAGDVELAQGLNSGEIVATNVFEQQTRKTQVFQRFPTIDSVTLVLGATPIPVTQGASIYVNSKQTKVRVVTEAAGASLLVNAKRFESRDLASGVDVVLDDLEEGKSMTVSFQIGFEVEELRSKPWQARLVLDTVVPELSDLKTSPPPPQPAATQITVSGAWQDAGGCASLTVDDQAADVKQTEGKSGCGTWSVKLKSPDKTRDLAVVVKDQAGNEKKVALPFEVAAPAPPPPPVAIPERVFEPDGFVRRLDCRVENGYPEFLIHKATGIELVAIDFGPGKKPAYYIAIQETTEQQWGAGSGTRPKANETYLSVISWLGAAARRGLDLPTTQEWDHMPAQWQKGLGFTEWLKTKGGTTAPLRKEPDRSEYAQNRTTPGISFRVVYRVP